VSDREKRPPAEPPPVNTGAEGVHAEPKRTGHRLLDLSIAVSAILISLTSLAIAIHHGRVQQKLVATNSWPFAAYLSRCGRNPRRLPMSQVTFTAARPLAA
jgi:hypothetical protein